MVDSCHVNICVFAVSAKDAKVRECFEKVFPELKKQREDKERLLGYVMLSLITTDLSASGC